MGTQVLLAADSVEQSTVKRLTPENIAQIEAVFRKAARS